MNRYIPLLLSLMFLAGCEGPMGPAGPQGERGAQGERGERGPEGQAAEKRQYSFTGNLDAEGYAGWYLPAELEERIRTPPVVACYLSAAIEGPYFLVATGDAQCAFGVETDGRSYVFTFSPANPGWFYIIVISY